MKRIRTSNLRFIRRGHNQLSYLLRTNEYRVKRQLKELWNRSSTELGSYEGGQSTNETCCVTQSKSRVHDCLDLELLAAEKHTHMRILRDCPRSHRGKK
jgi:hypothetical protein